MRAAVCVALALGSACLPAITPAADNAIDARYRLAATGARGGTDGVAATRIYRWFGERSLAVPSRCKMLPTDSEAFAARAQRCGGLAAWYQGIARLLLEQASDERFARSLRLDGRLRWLDLPGPCE